MQRNTLKIDTVKPPIGNTPMAEHTANTEQFPWSQHALLTYQRFQLRNNFLSGTKNLVPNPFLIWSFYCINIKLKFHHEDSKCVLQHYSRVSTMAEVNNIENIYIHGTSVGNKVIKVGVETPRFSKFLFSKYRVNSHLGPALFKI